MDLRKKKKKNKKRETVHKQPRAIGKVLLLINNLLNDSLQQCQRCV